LPLASTIVIRNTYIFRTKWTNRNFCRKKIGGRGFNLTSYVWGVALELREALKGLIEEIEN